MYFYDFNTPPPSIMHNNTQEKHGYYEYTFQLGNFRLLNNNLSINLVNKSTIKMKFYVSAFIRLLIITIYKSHVSTYLVIKYELKNLLEVYFNL